MLGLIGNKGAVAASFGVYSTSLCMVCAHLASGTSAVEARNLEYAQLLQRIAFPTPPAELATDADAPPSVLEHDAVFWFGDLNSRINLDADATRSLAMRGELEQLRLHDQLLASQRAGAAFEGFVEGVLDFPPSYKYDIGTDVFDTSEKRRPPAWCDRVLWRATALKAHSGPRDAGAATEGEAATLPAPAPDTPLRTNRCGIKCG